MTRTWRRVLAAVGVGALLTVGSVVTAAPANAIVVGVCTMNAQNPHGSTHVAGTINTVGTASCSIVMSEIYVKAVLYRADGASWAGAASDYFNTNYEQSNAATSCSAGPATFRMSLSYVLRAPAGYDPAYSANTIYSPWVSVACGASFAATQKAVAEQLPELTETVQFLPGS